MSTHLIKEAQMSEYGKKGGTSANSGRTATTYTVTFPDGTTASKKSFHVHADKAFAGIFQDKGGEWIVAGIASEPKDWHGQTWVEAVAAKKPSRPWSCTPYVADCNWENRITKALG
jgi:hypothetical protein